MAVPFDHIASAYDSLFTNTVIGQLQRKCVWNYMEKVMGELKGFEMLELNCGTGEDAVLFGERGFNIIATDISSEMLKLTSKKAEQFSMQNKISSRYLDLESFDGTVFDKKFDLVFSNFGGLNCINPDSLRKLLNKLPLILNPGGRVIGVIMPKFCAWETFYFLLRLQFRKAFRRLSSREVTANINGADIKTWYYSPSDIRKWSVNEFRIMGVNPVGVALPPSYLHKFFNVHKRLLLALNTVEKKLGRTSLFAGMSDHFIIDLQLR